MIFEKKTKQNRYIIQEIVNLSFNTEEETVIMCKTLKKALAIGCCVMSYV